MAEQTEHEDLRVRRDGGNVFDRRQVVEWVVEPRSDWSRCYHVVVFVVLLSVLLANIESFVIFKFKDLHRQLWSCYFVLAGQIALTILLILSALICLILVKFKVKMLAGFRAVDMAGAFVFYILSFAMFEVMSLGLETTCTNANEASKENACKIEGLIDFYQLISVSKFTMLGIALFFLLFFLWNLILLIFYTIKDVCCIQPNGEDARSPLLPTSTNLYTPSKENPFTEDAHIS